jgi:hypothetical protein
MRARLVSWAPSWVAVLGTAVVALLLVMPIYTLGPGDHDRKSCGNALTLNLERWRATPVDSWERRHYWERAYRACTAVRVDRVARAVGVATVTVLIVTVMTTRRSVRGSASWGDD